MSEHVREGHPPLLGATARGGKGPWSLLLVLVGCAAPPPPAPKPVAPVVTATAEPVVVLPPSLQEESKRLLATAATTQDPHERCKLLSEAATLDPSPEARLARAESRCAPATVLLEDARAVFAAKKDARSATVLATVATRAEAKVDALAAAEVLVAQPDVAAMGLGARTFGRFGEFTRAASAYDLVAKARGDKGAVVDALDATIEAAMWTARAHGPDVKARLVAAIELAKGLVATYGAAWVRPRFVEAIAILRALGDPAGAKAVDAQAEKVLVLAQEEGHAIERAVADARAGKPEVAKLLAKKVRAERLASPPHRALLAVVARVGGKCGVARAHARAHANLPEATLTLADDVRWAADCDGNADEATLVPPRPVAVVDDATAVAVADPLRARSILETWVGAHADDVAARLALAALLPSSARPAVLAGPTLAREPSLLLALVEASTGSARADAARLLAAVLPSTVEAAVDPRATTPLLARAMSFAGPEDGWLDVAEGLLHACAAPRKAKACADGPALLAASTHLRRTRPAALCATGVALADADLGTARFRLDVTLACTSKKKLLPALSVTDEARGPFPSPEGALARAALATLQKKCPLARGNLVAASALKGEYPDEFAAVEAQCPAP
ncbi:MAG: hypothetical protein IPJ34_21925 [Myxococcales bacterium]|nr:hypothetical protein [Myxococcales bacterium]